jgi:hypothetical protein
MGFDSQGAFDHAANSLDLIGWNFRCPPTPTHYGVDPRRRNYIQHPVKTTMDEYIIGEERERELLLAILPLVDGSILR